MVPCEESNAQQAKRSENGATAEARQISKRGEARGERERASTARNEQKEARERKGRCNSKGGDATATVKDHMEERSKSKMDRGS